MIVLRIGKVLKVDHVAFSPDGRSLVGCTEFGAYFWPEMGAAVRPTHIPGTSWTRFAKFTPDGREFFVAGTTLVRMDVATGAESIVPLWGEHYIDFDFSPDGRTLVVSQTAQTNGFFSLRLACRTLDREKAKTLWEHTQRNVDTSRPQFLPDGKQFVRIEATATSYVNHREDQIVTYDAKTGKVTGKSEVFTQGMRDAVISPDGCWFAGADDANLHLRPIEPNPEPPAVITNDTKKPFSAVAFHPGGRFLAATSNSKLERVVKFYDLTTQKPLRTFAWDIGKLRSVCFSVDGTLAAAGSENGKVVVWDVDL